MASISLTAGLFLRRKVRWQAAARGLSVQEFKGLMESDFVVTGEMDSLLSFWSWCATQDSNVPPPPTTPTFGGSDG